ncbi:hypothetical protein [Methylobacterium planeticum]|uniref:Uncharacterized protein n=1 Tax=Methylobacterium planeticum TaxID=2615211 RepID=A0A6N6MT60_9HYPH|nr:hypothetical protein [Methylobacterium planeticum]KAB1073633.1 hypothetical protein F6X51_10590 [Methylobacterium planeticum]
MIPRFLIAVLLAAALAPAAASARDGSAPGDGSVSTLQPAQAGREAESLLRELRRDQARTPAPGGALSPGTPMRKQADRMRREMAADKKGRGARKASRPDQITADPVPRGICIGCR